MKTRRTRTEIDGECALDSPFIEYLFNAVIAGKVMRHTDLTQGLPGIRKRAE